MKTVILLLAILTSGEHTGHTVAVDAFTNAHECRTVQEYLSSVPFFSNNTLYVCAEVTDDQGGH